MFSGLWCGTFPPELRKMCNWSGVFFTLTSARFRLFLSDRKMRNLAVWWHQKSRFICSFLCCSLLLWWTRREVFSPFFLLFFFLFCLSLFFVVCMDVFGISVVWHFRVEEDEQRWSGFFVTVITRFRLFLSDRKMWNLVMSWCKKTSFHLLALLLARFCGVPLLLENSSRVFFLFFFIFFFLFFFCNCDVSSLWLLFCFSSFADSFLLWFVWWLKQIKHHYAAFPRFRLFLNDRKMQNLGEVG